MKPVVVRNIKRADNNAIGTLAAVGVSTAHEALGRSGLMKPYMRPIWAGAQIAGPAVTVLAQPGDNWMIHVAVEQCQKGDVLVVGCTADNSDGMFGELLATRCGHGCHRPRDRRWLSRRASTIGNAFSGVVEGDLGQGHGESHSRRGQRPCGVRWRQRGTGRCRCCGRRWRCRDPEKTRHRDSAEGAKAQGRRGRKAEAT